MTILNQLGKRADVNRAGGTTCVIKCTGKGWGKKKVMSGTERAEI